MGMRPKNVYVGINVVIIYCSWVKKLYNDCFQKWKIIPLHLLGKYFGFSFKVHSKLHFGSEVLVLEDFPSYCK